MVLTTIPTDPLLDLDPWVGQRSCTFKFYVTDAATQNVLGQIYPLREAASLTHNTTSTIKRQLQLDLGAADSAAINPVADRVEPKMVFANGVEYPLGRYIYTTALSRQFTSGSLVTATFNDEMVIIDQPILKGIDAGTRNIGVVVQSMVGAKKIQYDIEPTTFSSIESWTVGTTAGQILEALATNGDYFSPWLDNNGKFRMIRTFDPSTQIADIDLDSGNRVLRNTITNDSDLLTAPNKIVVVSNGTGTTSIVTATAEVPDSAPHSAKNRGFDLIQVVNLQVTSLQQAAAVAAGLVQRQTIFERCTLTTAPDPRHDSYNVIRWQGENWLELSWSMALTAGGEMNHLLRKAYR